MSGFKTTFQSIDKDIDRWMQLYGTHDTLSDGTPVLRGIDKANQFVLDLYFEHEAWDPLVQRFAKTADWAASPEFTRLNDALVERRDVRRLTRLWSAVIAEHKLRFWEYHAFCGKGRVAGSPESRFYEGADSEAKLLSKKTRLLETLDHALTIMDSLGESRYALQLHGDRESIQQETRGKNLLKPIARAMNEDCFWDLIETAKRNSESSTAQMDLLLTALEAFKATEIRKFRQLLDAKMDALLHWDLWAFAYLAMDGCSDDAFESFRAWLILQGRHAAVETMDLPPGPYEADGLLSIPGIAYENRSGKPLLVARRKAASMQGEPWEEQDLPTRYPLLYQKFHK